MNCPTKTAADLNLLTTEVVSNAVRHASRSSTDEVIVRAAADEMIRVEVVDGGSLFKPPVLDGPHDVWSSG
jgi:anti-sigma regulatory factor (Ser/Thr protein kinase)